MNWHFKKMKVEVDLKLLQITAQALYYFQFQELAVSC